MSLWRRSIAEALATGFLLAIIVGSGVMAERLAAGNAAIALLANALATGCGLAALIVTFAPISGAHMNPAITLALAVRGDHPWREVPAYVGAQFAGALAGVCVAHAMFAMPLVELSTKPRAGIAQVFAEAIATLGLLIVVMRGARQRPDSVPWSVACYITAAYWFTSSTSFANPAVTLARATTDSFTGIGLAYVPGFWLGQLVGAALALWTDRVLGDAHITASRN